MKRAILALLLTLMIVPTGNASFWKRQHKPDATKAVTAESAAKKPIPATGLIPGKKQIGALSSDGGDLQAGPGTPPSGPIPFAPPIEMALTRAASRVFDLRSLPQTPPEKLERPEREEPELNRGTVNGVLAPPDTSPSTPSIPPRNAPAPPTIQNFDGLNFALNGNGHPPDTNGDVGPNHYIQTINTSIGIYQKNGTPIASFTFNTFMSQGAFGNLCDTNNFGDPVVLYDSFEDRWIITDFAFQLSGGNVVNPPGSFQCFAASKTGDPVSGGWNFYSINTANGLGDYPKFGIWPDGLYMSTNMFAYISGGSFMTARAYAFNKAQMYAGKPAVQVATFDIPGGDFTVLPSNARLQAGSPPPGSPNYFVSTWEFLNAVTVYKFHVNWNALALSTFTGPDIPLAATSWPNAGVPNAQSLGGHNNLAASPPEGLDVLQIRAMVQNQYSKIGAAESLWLAHTVRRGNTSGLAAPRWYQVDVTGGAVNANLPQAATWDPDGANVISRFMPSVAVDRAGNMALGYSTSDATTKPAIKYAGRLSTDPVNTLGQTEQLLVQGTGTQSGTCGGNCTRWGDYSGMTLDPDGCTFWYTNMYYNVDGLNHLTRIGSFAFPSCTPFGAGGTITGTVTSNPGGAPLSGATIRLGARSTATDGSGVYSFPSLPAGAYPTLTASLPGFVSGSASNEVVTDGGSTTQDFSLAATPTTGCLTDTTQADFQAGVPTNTDISTSPNDVILVKPGLDQFNTNVPGSGGGISTATWVGQTFTPSVTGLLVKADLDLFCSGCSGTPQNLTLSVRATAGGVPTGSDLASATIPGFLSGSAIYYSVTFGSPVTVTAGTLYALLIRPNVNPTGTYAAIRSTINGGALGVDVYSGGTRVLSGDSGSTWSIPLTGGVSSDLGFHTFINSGFNPVGTLVSLKDSGPASGLTPIWSTLSWTATTPANTSVKFQIAASNSDSGPFNFVGPDGTGATFFTTSGASLAQFYNFRYLEYKAILSSTDGVSTPTLNDVTICFADTDCSAPITITPTPAQVCANSTGNTASGPAGETSYAWSITNGTIVGSSTSQSVTYTAGASGTVGLQLDIVEAGGCHKTATTNVTINPPPPTPAIKPGGPTTFTYPGNVTLDAGGAAASYQWYVDTGSGPTLIGGETNEEYVASASGSYTVTVTDVNGCNSASSAPTTVVVNPATPMVTATGGTFVYNGNPQPGSGTATGGAGESLTVTLSYSGTGATVYGPSATAPSLVGTYSVTAHTPGDANNTAGDSAPAALTITKATPTVTATGGTFTYDGNPHAGSGSATGGGGESLTVSTLTYNGTGSTTYGPSTTAPSLAGTYTVTAHTPGDANNNAGDSSATALTINKFNTLMAAFGGTFTYNGAPRAGSGQAIGGAGETFPVTLSYQGISGTTYGPTAAPPTNVGVYLVTAHTVGDANNNAEDSLPNALRINKATATIGVTGYCVAFDGSAHTAVGTATGVLSEALTGLVVSATTHTAAGTYAGDAWSFTNANYSDASGTVNDSIVNATITAAPSATTGTTGNVASVANAGAGATYVWGITNGSITGGAGTTSITFTAGAVGTLTLNVTVTTSVGCGIASPAANVTVLPLVTVTSISPTGGTVTGGNTVTINGSGFASGASVTLGGTAATSVVVVSAIKITAKTPAHAAGAVNVTVTNTNTASGTLTNGFLYSPQVFDPNNDGTITSADIFYLVNYLFMNGPAPNGPGGVLSGDANGDGVVSSADIFYLVNYLFLGGQKPNAPSSALPSLPRASALGAEGPQLSGSITLGKAVLRAGRYVVPVIMTANPGSITPQSMSFRAHFESDGTLGDIAVRSAGAAKDAGVPLFEIGPRMENDLSYLVSYDPRNGGLNLGASHSAVVAEIEIASNNANIAISLDPTVTMLSDQAGTITATVANGKLRVSGTTIRSDASPQPRAPRSEVN